MEKKSWKLSNCLIFAILEAIKNDEYIVNQEDKARLLVSFL